MRKKKSYDHIPADLRQQQKVALRRGYLDNYDDEWQYSFVGEFLLCNPQRVKILDTFRELVGHIPTWEDITERNLRQLRDIMAQSLCPSTLHTRLASLSASISSRLSSIPISAENYKKILNSKNQKSQAIFLNEDEVESIHQYQPANQEEAFAKRIFLLGCYTLARHSDCLRFTTANIQNGNFVYTSQKTKITATLPVHRNLMHYLCGPNVQMWDYQFNELIRDICRKVGICQPTTLFRAGAEQTAPKYTFVASHTARRSGATNLYLRGADLLTISRMMGHTDTHTTQRYIIGYRELNDSVAAFFN